MNLTRFKVWKEDWFPSFHSFFSISCTALPVNWKKVFPWYCVQCVCVHCMSRLTIHPGLLWVTPRMTCIWQFTAEWGLPFIILPEASHSTRHTKGLGLGDCTGDGGGSQSRSQRVTHTLCPLCIDFLWPLCLNFGDSKANDLLFFIIFFIIFLGVG